MGKTGFPQNAKSKVRYDHHRVLPPNQCLFGSEYDGSVKLKIWQFGHWKDILIDDRLPLINDKYIYGHCDDPTEFWVALIEKAFAKVE